MFVVFVLNLRIQVSLLFLICFNIAFTSLVLSIFSFFNSSVVCRFQIMSTEEERARDLANRERFRRDKPSRFSDGNKDRDRSTDRSERTRRPSKHRVYVANICYDYRWHDLKDLFRTHVGDVQYVEMFVDENDKFKGCAIIEFSDAASVKKCIEVMHRFNLKGRKLVVKEDLGDERDKYGNFVNERKNRELDHKDDNRRDRNWDAPQSLMGSLFDRQHSENTENKIGQTWGLSTQFLESLGINRPLVSRVFVANVSTNFFIRLKVLRLNSSRSRGRRIPKQ